MGRLRLVENRRPDESPPTGDAPVEVLYRAYAPYVAAVALRLLGRRDEIDDLVQDVFLAAQRGVAALRDPGAVRGWLATVAVRLARRRLRTRRIRALIGLDRGPGPDEALAPDASPETAAEAAELFARLDELPVPERLAWSLRYLQGEALERVAELCNCSLPTAKRRIAAAHEKMRGWARG